MTTNIQEVVAEALKEVGSDMDREIGPKFSGLVSASEPDETLWNIFNVIEVLSGVVEDDIDDSRGRGVACMLQECKAAAAYEAERLGRLFDKLNKEAEH